MREFADASGTAYGVLLDAWAWTRQMKRNDDLGHRLAVAAGITEAGLNSRDAAQQRARQYGGDELRIAEEKRDVEQKARVAELRRRFVDGPVLILPNAGGSFRSAGITPIPRCRNSIPSRAGHRRVGHAGCRLCAAARGQE